VNRKLLKQASFAIICVMTWFSFLVCLPENAFSQDDGSISRKVVVGLIEVPPLYMKTADDQWEGLGIDIWKAVAQDIGMLFEFREYKNYGLLLEAIESGEIDAIPSLPAELRYEVAMDLSQSYFKSGLAIAVPTEGGDHRWIHIVEKIFSKEILEAVLFLLLICLAAGIMVFLFERRCNKEMFSHRPLEGIGQGIWWSIVTMTTVGYGDKTPKTIGGRIVAIIWMLFSIVFIASFTANITASLTISGLKGKVRSFQDLHNVRVGAISQSETENFLANHEISIIPFESVKEGLNALADKKINAFVSNELMLKYAIKNEFQGRLQVIPGIFDEYFVVIALNKNNPMRKEVNKALLKFMKTDKWHELLNRYI